MDGAAELSNLDLVLVDKDDVTWYIWFNGLDLHVRGCGEGGQIVSHKPSWEGTHFFKGQPMELGQEIFLTDEFCVPVVDSEKNLWHGIDRSSSCNRDLYDYIKAKLDGAVFK